MKQRCNGCKFFDCGDECQCHCHYGSAPKISNNLDFESGKNTIKNEEQSMEGLASLFG